MKKWIYSGTREEQPSERELMHGKLAKKAASEGIVLLKNEGILPLKKDTAAALLGYGAEKTVKGGIGSGDVNNRKNISIYQGLKEAGVKIVSEDWISDYHNRYEQAREAWKEKVLEEAKKVDNPFDAYAENPFAMPLGRKVAEEDICEADVVIYVISRISGEGKDRRKVKGDYYLSEREEEDLRYLAEMNKPVILILNAGGPVELTDILEQTDNIKGILNISQLGQEGGDALADVLLGKEVPGGKLTTTWARRYEDYPASEEYGYLNGNLEKEKYKEGIYVGYRYFDSFDKKVMFPFGFGLSYTMFEMKCCSINMEESKIRAEVQVTNTGNEYAGKEVVQIYLHAPQGLLGKADKSLCAFEKTRLLQPGETQLLSFEISMDKQASYDDLGKIKKSAYVLEKGDYTFYVGTSVEQTMQADFVYTLEEDKIVEQLTSKLVPSVLKKRMLSDGTFEELPQTEPADTDACAIPFEAKEPLDGLTPKTRVIEPVCLWKWRYKEGIRPFTEVAEGKMSLDEFLAQMTDEELAHLLGGQPNTGVSNTFGIGNMPFRPLLRRTDRRDCVSNRSAVSIQRHGHVPHCWHLPGIRTLFTG